MFGGFILISVEDIVDAGVGESALINFREKKKRTMHVGKMVIGNTNYY